MAAVPRTRALRARAAINHRQGVHVPNCHSRHARPIEADEIQTGLCMCACMRAWLSPSISPALCIEVSAPASAWFLLAERMTLHRATPQQASTAATDQQLACPAAAAGADPGGPVPAAAHQAGRRHPDRRARRAAVRRDGAPLLGDCPLACQSICPPRLAAAKA